MKRILRLSIVVVLLLTIAVETRAHYANKLILVSLDGFRWDYLNKTDTPNLDRLIKDGAHIKKMTGEFPSITFPSHWTIVTGVYSEVHGVIDNKMYDPVYEEVFSYGNDGKWYNNTLPIWLEVEQQGQKSGTYFWTGSDAEIRGMRPSFYKDYDGSVPYLTRINTVVDWLKNEDVNFATLYYNEPDHEGHGSGPDSPDVLKQIETVDLLMGYLMDKLKENGLTDSVNLIVTSDHGMATRPKANFLRVANYIDVDNEIEFGRYGSVANLLPKNLSKTQELYDQLKDMPNAQVFLKEDIPEKYHYKNSRRVHPIVIVADVGYYISPKSNTNLKGYHGYDPESDDMKALLIARGPNFCCGCKRENGRAIDMYSMMAELLQITPHPHNGSLSRINDILLTNEESCHVTGGGVQLPAATVWIVGLATATKLMLV